jgi:CBS domain-containing protein
MPVVSDAGKIVGFVSDGDIMRYSVADYLGSI